MAGSISGAGVSLTDFGPPERMIPGGPAGHQLGGRGGVGDDLRVDVGLTDPAGDQLGVLGPEVDDQDRPVTGVIEPEGGRAQWPMPTPCERCRSLPSVWSAGATITSAFWNSLTVW